MKNPCSKMLQALLGAAFALVAVWPAATVRAQTFPSRPVTLVVAYSPGGSTDTLARTIAEKLQTRLGQPVVVENKPGGGTTIATGFVRQAAADGHTLYVVTSQFGQMPVVNPSIAKYDPIRDFTPIGQATSMLMVLVANPRFPAGNVRELLDYAKANPGKVSVATTGVGSTDHLGGELLAYKTGASFNFIPYKGGAPAVQDVMAGVADVRLDAMPSSRAHIESGKLKALAVFETRRHPGFPDIPAITETVPGVEFGGYFGVIGPKGMPGAVVARLNKELSDIMKLPDVSAKMSGLGLEPATGSAEQFVEVIQKDHDQWAKLLKDTGLKIEP
jgi:tripartite-type tricarboxylate transporter receptor subunit TctC